MYYQCISIDTQCFRWTSADDSSSPIDPYNILLGIQEAKPHFIFRLADIGPFEAFGDYPLLLAVVRSVRTTGFSPRLLTSAAHFRNTDQTLSQFIELASLGVTRIVLRLDRMKAEALPDLNLINFVNGCAASGMNGDVRFDLEDIVPEAFFRVARIIEETRFYTEIYPRAKLKTNHSRFLGERLNRRIGQSAFRVVIASDGTVLLRSRSKKVAEVEVGSLLEAPLPRLIDPSRLFTCSSATSLEVRHDV